MSNTVQQGRIDKVLDTIMDFDGFGVMSRREWLKACFRDGSYYSDTYLDHPFTWSNKKFNNLPEWQDQQEYEKKYHTLKTKYAIKKHGCDTFSLVTKIEFDYFNSLIKGE
jgi:hypothetical protein